MRRGGEGGHRRGLSVDLGSRMCLTSDFCGFGWGLLAKNMSQVSLVEHHDRALPSQRRGERESGGGRRMRKIEGSRQEMNVTLT